MPELVAVLELDKATKFEDVVEKAVRKRQRQRKQIECCVKDYQTVVALSLGVLDGVFFTQATLIFHVSVPFFNLVRSIHAAFSRVRRVAKAFSA